MFGLNGRITRLEDEFSPDDDRPSLAERLTDAIQEARERQRLGLPRPEPPWDDADDPLAQRMRQAMARAEACRQQLASE